VLAVTIRAADLDGDGFPDIITCAGSNDRDVDGMPRTRNVLMNRPDPSDPAGKRRILVDTTEESGLLATRDGMGNRSFNVANIGDVNGDGFPDVITCAGGDTSPDGCDTFLNDGTGHFTLAPESALSMAAPWQVASAAFLDFDRDGKLDFWPATFGITPLLFKGNGDGTFTNVALQWGLPLFNGDPARFQALPQVFGVTACDIDGDGDLDVIFADYGRQANQVWRNDGDKFTEIGMQLGVAFDDNMDYSDNQSYWCWCKANPGMCNPEPPTPALQCPGRGWTPGQDDQPWRLGGNNFSIACADLDNDGDMDLMTATIVHWDVGQSSDPSQLLYNDTPPGQDLMKFRRVPNSQSGLARMHSMPDWNDGDMTPLLLDVDNDGRKDIYLSSSDYPGTQGWLWHQKDDGTFEDVTTRAGVLQTSVHGNILVDLDGDGDLDLVTGTSDFRQSAPNKAMRVFRNDVGHTRNALQIRLVGAGVGKSNPSAIGARVRVTAGGVTQTQEVSGGYGLGSAQNDLLLTFGLGAACAVDQVEVRWADKQATTETFQNVRANYRLELVEGTGKLTYGRPLP
jgi:hypothetical protein